MFENLPQSALQLYETFQLGQTVGGFKMFSVGFSIVLFQKVVAELLPLVLYQLETKLKEYPKWSIFLKIFTVLFSWSFVYYVMAMPFMLFFEADRTEWLKENGIEIIDWDEQR